jgi:hypothetical protein
MERNQKWLARCEVAKVCRAQSSQRDSIVFVSRGPRRAHFAAERSTTPEFCAAYSAALVEAIAMENDGYE